jgi:hypothetical protein
VSQRLRYWWLTRVLDGLAGRADARTGQPRGDLLGGPLPHFLAAINAQAEGWFADEEAAYRGKTAELAGKVAAKQREAREVGSQVAAAQESAAELRVSADEAAKRLAEELAIEAEHRPGQAVSAWEEPIAERLQREELRRRQVQARQNSVNKAEAEARRVQAYADELRALSSRLLAEAARLQAEICAEHHQARIETERIRAHVQRRHRRYWRASTRRRNDGSELDSILAERPSWPGLPGWTQEPPFPDPSE